MIRIILVDDHDIFRAGLGKLLETEPDMKIVGETGIGREAITLCKQLEPDIALLDIDLPDTDGLALSSQMISIYPEVKIVFLTMYDSEEFAARALKSGAGGYISKGMSPGLLADALRKVAAGNIFVSPSLQEKLIAKQFNPGGSNPLESLSERELTILREIARGRTTKEIAGNLFISESTVKFHRKNLCDKLNIFNNVELAKFALSHNLIK
ncbi:MAG TPA: response regulator transcription factor [bacterium]|nr:response regulator transcription factor [bacterium]